MTIFRSMALAAADITSSDSIGARTWTQGRAVRRAAEHAGYFPNCRLDFPDSSAICNAHAFKTRYDTIFRRSQNYNMLAKLSCTMGHAANAMPSDGQIFSANSRPGE